MLTPGPLYRFSIMLQCWASDPEDRPTFASLISNLASNLATMADYLTLGQDFNPSLKTTVANDNEVSVRYVRDPTSPREQTLEEGYVDLNGRDIFTNAAIDGGHGRLQSSTSSSTVAMTNDNVVSLSDLAVNVTVEDI